MQVTVTWWDLDGTGQTVESMRARLRDEGVRTWESVEGLRLKFWVSDRARNRWGAVMLWESPGSEDQQLPPNRAAELIGGPPTERVRFDVEAGVEGVFMHEQLSGRGLALEE